MINFLRKTQLLFGGAAGPTQIGVFGSFAASAPAYSSDPAVIQSLSNYVDGWFAAVVGGNSPCIEDMNALCYLFAYQLSYLLQKGIPQYDAATTYYTGDLCASGGLIYQSLIDNNVGNSLLSAADWKLQGNTVRKTLVTDPILQTDSFIRCDPTAASFVETLPAVAATPIGKRFIVKNVATNGNTVTLTGNGAELIDAANTLILNSQPIQDSVTVINNGVSWDLI